MSNVIDFYKWKAKRRAQLGCDPARACQRRARRGQSRKQTLTTGLDLSAEMRRLLE